MYPDASSTCVGGMYRLSGTGMYHVSSAGTHHSDQIGRRKRLPPSGQRAPRGVRSQPSLIVLRGSRDPKECTDQALASVHGGCTRNPLAAGTKCLPCCINGLRCRPPACHYLSQESKAPWHTISGFDITVHYSRFKVVKYLLHPERQAPRCVYACPHKHAPQHAPAASSTMMQYHAHV